jgi:hypothetical protein
MTDAVADGECVVVGRSERATVLAFHHEREWFLFRLDVVARKCHRSGCFPCFAAATAALRWGTVEWRAAL